ncbi:DNA polymerase III subunit delta [Corynebacterium sp. zg254]|uniref:DNA polymerase III subunit delta n=1 Tax=Corynebacterium zhongnanshanii TaxID=2768834 RepID=A0ABQ6VDC5_9CORY|nr:MULTISPECIES: DNA polymerase III subunit delta [Corynebacterium]KAB3520930.1 DNA polymerase III subunit delta [Corynebacterium zhongnanshanii]MCR5914560.1 DNA polymerase III subunit delta [Corynebacterium sp. zg254]
MPSPSRSAAQPPAPIHVIAGADEFLAERRRQEIVDATRSYEQDPHIPVETFKANEVDPGVLAELLSPSLFSDSRIIVIHGVEDCGKEPLGFITAAMEQPVPGMVLIIIHKGTGRNKKMVQTWAGMGAQMHEAAELRPREKQAFVDQEFRRHGTRVSPDVVQLLLEVVGSDLRELASAVSQLVADTNGSIDTAAVKRYYTGKAEVTGFDIADYAVVGNVAAAASLTRRALQLGESPVMISAALNRNVSGIAKVVGAGRIDSRRDASRFGMAPWQLDRTIKTARHWTPAMVARAVQILAELDAGVKGGSASADYALEHGVITLARLVAQRGGTR